MLLATIILSISGYEPAAVFRGLSRGVTTDFGGTIRWTTPLIFCGLAVAIAFRAGVFNLGVDGQLYLGSVAATAVGLYLANSMAPILGIVLAILVGAAVGALWALIPAILLVKWKTDEVVTTLLLNFIAVLFTDFLVMGPMMGTGSTGTTYSTDNLPVFMKLPLILLPSKANIGLYIAVLLALLLTFIVYRTTLGYELKIVGSNPLFAKYGGVRSKRVVVTTMLISGAIAGLAGAIEIIGVHHRFPGRYNSGLGFDGIVVALLANNNPIGVLISGLFFGALRNGSMNMERITDVPRAMVQVIQAVIILLVTAKFALDFLKKKNKQKGLEEDEVSENGGGLENG
jgi:simple sugar transport system permease protein